jgi:hypothetical protein
MLIKRLGTAGVLLALGVGLAVVIAGTTSAAPGPQPLFRPSTFDMVFNNVTLGSSASQVLTVGNGGKAPELFSSIAVKGPNAGDFAIGSDGCTGQSVQPGSHCTMNIVFAPTAQGTRVAQLKFLDNSNCPNYVHLAGGGGQASTRAVAHAANCLPGNGGTKTQTLTVSTAPSSNPPCTSKRQFKFTVAAPKGKAFSSLGAVVAQRKLKVTRSKSNHKGTVHVDLRGLQHGRYAVRLAGKLSPSGTYSKRKYYVTCTSRKLN